MDIDKDLILEWKELVVNHNVTFAIEKYQRFYEWDKKNIDDFIDSIARGVFIGSATFFTNDDGSIEIIDGQQRLTTLFLIFGGNNINFTLNLPSGKTDTFMAILMDTANKTHHAEIDKSMYLTRVYELKEYAKESLEKLFNGKKYKTINNISDLLSKTYFPIVRIPNKEVVSLIFRRINNKGIKVGVSSLYKSSLIEKNRDLADTITSNWYEATDLIYKVRYGKYVSNPKVDDIFLQSYNATRNSTDWITAGKKVFDKKFLNTTDPSNFYNYIKWASKYLIKIPDKKLNIKELLTLMIYTLNGKITNEAPMLAYSIFHLKGVEKLELGSIMETATLLSLLSNIYVSSDDVNKKSYKNAVKTVHDYTKNNDIKNDLSAFNDILASSIEELCETWTGSFKDKFINDIKFTYIGTDSSYTDNTYNMDKNTLKIAFGIKEALFMISNKKLEGDDIYAADILEIVNGISYGKMNNMTVEHLLNKDEPNLLYLDFCTSKGQEILGDNDINDKINSIVNASEEDKGKFYKQNEFEKRHSLEKLRGNHE